MSHATALPGQAPARFDGTTLGLYVITVIMWGVSWIGMKAQVGIVAPEMSVLWRFVLAAGVMWVWVLATGKPMRFSIADHLRFAVLGLLYLFIARPDSKSDAPQGDAIHVAELLRTHRD